MARACLLNKHVQSSQHLIVIKEHEHVIVSLCNFIATAQTQLWKPLTCLCNLLITEMQATGRIDLQEQTVYSSVHFIYNRGRSNLLIQIYWYKYLYLGERSRGWRELHPPSPNSPGADTAPRFAWARARRSSFHQSVATGYAGGRAPPKMEGRSKWGFLSFEG